MCRATIVDQITDCLQSKGTKSFVNELKKKGKQEKQPLHKNAIDVENSCAIFLNLESTWKFAFNDHNFYWYTSCRLDWLWSVSSTQWVVWNSNVIYPKLYLWILMQNNICMFAFHDWNRRKLIKANERSWPRQYCCWCCRRLVVGLPQVCILDLLSLVF